MYCPVVPVVTVRVVPIIAVSIGDGGDMSPAGTHHLVKHMLDSSRVITMCGREIIALPSTWAKTRQCVKCYGTETFPQGIVTAIGEIEHPRPVNGFPDRSRERRVVHALFCLRNASSKKYARDIARSLGYNPPERILDEHPEFTDKIVYVNKGMKDRHDPDRVER